MERILIQEVFEIQKRSNLFKTYETVFFETDGKLIFKDRQSILILKNGVLEKSKNSTNISQNHNILVDWTCDAYRFNNSGWEYKSFSGWTFQPQIFTNIRRRRWTRLIFCNCDCEKSKHIAVKPFYVFSNKENKAKAVESHKSLIQYYTEIKESKMKPTVLLLGGSGSGKSSLVNAVFGKTIAEIGSGKPITKSYSKYTSDNSPVIIYDSRGIEHSKIEDFVEDTKLFFQKLVAEPKIENHIHVIWYIVDLTQTRFQMFEANFCKKNLGNYPIVFVFNKADAVRKDVMEKMIKTVQESNIINSIGELETVSDRKNFDVKNCPSVKCNSMKIKKRLKDGTCTVLCKECKEKNVLGKTQNIEKLSELTLSKMPKIVKLAFMEANISILRANEDNVKGIIEIEADKKSMLGNLGVMIERLAVVIKKILKVYNLEILEKVFIGMIHERLNSYFKNKNVLKFSFMILGDVFSWKKESQVYSSIVLLVGLYVANSCMNFKRMLCSSITNEDEFKTSIIEKVIIQTAKIELIDDEIKLVLKELKLMGKIKKYLEKIVIDGKFLFETKKEEQKIDDEEEIEILTSYQKINKKN